MIIKLPELFYLEPVCICNLYG